MASRDEGERQKAKRHLAQLRRRRDFLASRVANYKGNSDSFDKAEMSALTWVIPLAEDEVERLAVEPANRR